MNDPEFSERESTFKTFRYHFDYVHDMQSTQEQVYERTAKDAVMATLEVLENSKKIQQIILFFLFFVIICFFIIKTSENAPT